MSNALWCNIDDAKTNAIGQIGHAFSETDPERQHFTKTQSINMQTGNSFGTPTYQQRQEVTETLDICGYHWRKQNPFQPSDKEATLRELEAENENYQRGFEAGEQHQRYTESHRTDGKKTSLYLARGRAKRV